MGNENGVKTVCTALLVHENDCMLKYNAALTGSHPLTALSQREDVIFVWKHWFRTGPQRLWLAKPLSLTVESRVSIATVSRVWVFSVLMEINSQELHIFYVKVQLAWFVACRACCPFRTCAFWENSEFVLHIVISTVRSCCFFSHLDCLQCSLKYSLRGTMLMHESTGTHRFAQIPADIFDND